MSNSPLNINFGSIARSFLQRSKGMGRREFQKSTTETLEGISEQLKSIGAQPDPSKIDSQVDPTAPVNEASASAVAPPEQVGAYGEVVEEEGSALALMKKYKGSCKLKKK